ncbi:hypothetical protein FRC04_000849 [Tulasnella sp. 424]|nr:hypothetical protein FRC04_000849 [Tulasnella sp. 424]KAG8969445.1 hypothetical protein FRC05_001080 [Tulasnella sp. 425]
MLAVISSVTPFSVSDSTTGVQISSSLFFSIGICSNLFHSSSSGAFYSEMLDEGRPLPEWLGFDNRTITFHDNPPSPDASSIPQTFNITVECTDYPNDTLHFMADVFVIVVTPGKGNTLVERDRRDGCNADFHTTYDPP